MPAEPALRLAVPLTEPTPTIPATQPGQLIRREDLQDLLAVSKATLTRLRAAGKIGPRAIRLGKQAVRWSHDEVMAWLTRRKGDGQLYTAREWPAVWASLQRDR
jgi:predicted DNA-binding transcriptional regulator AlpA